MSVERQRSNRLDGMQAQGFVFAMEAMHVGVGRSKSHGGCRDRSGNTSGLRLHGCRGDSGHGRDEHGDRGGGLEAKHMNGRSRFHRKRVIRRRREQ